jgi:hypothetical protein
MDLNSFKDKNGIIDLRVMRQDVWRRQRSRVMVVLFVASLFTMVYAATMLADCTGYAVQGMLLGAGLAWMTGCSWVQDARPDTDLARRARELLPLALIPCVGVALIPVVF